MLLLMALMLIMMGRDDAQCFVKLVLMMILLFIVVTTMITAGNYTKVQATTHKSKHLRIIHIHMEARQTHLRNLPSIQKKTIGTQHMQTTTHKTKLLQRSPSYYTYVQASTHKSKQLHISPTHYAENQATTHKSPFFFQPAAFSIRWGSRAVAKNRVAVYPFQISVER